MKRDISSSEQGTIDAVFKASQVPGLDSISRIYLGFALDTLRVVFGEADAAHAYYLSAVRGIEERKAREFAAFLASVDSTVQSVQSVQALASGQTHERDHAEAVEGGAS